MRTITLTGSLITLAFAMCAQSKNAVEQKLTSEYALTQATANYSDIVTAGSILVLKKSNVVMPVIGQTDIYKNTYKDGKINHSIFGKTMRIPGVPSQSAAGTRTFVAGEKVWVTRIECKDDGVVFELFSDPIYDVRFHAGLKVAFPKGPIPPAAEVSKLVAEVFSIQPAEGGDNSAQQQQQGGQQQQQVQQQAPPPAAAPLAPIAPPPPPADVPQAPPKTLSLGMTKDQVIASFGQPDKVVKLAGTKEYDFYKDLGRVTFVNGKVTDVQ